MATTMKAGRAKVDAGRLYRSLKELARIGAYRDEATGLVGVNRLALSEADGRGRRRVVSWFEKEGLAVSVDRVGNVYGRREGAEPGLAPVLIGSHIDSVPTAGAFDGCLGVLGALEVVRTLNSRDALTRRPLVVGFFTEEEGCRFGTDMLGSAVATGRIPLAKAYELRDRDGLSVKAELRKIGFLGRRDERSLKPHAYVECHIEQGPILGRRGVDIGVVSGVQAISWREVTIEGRAAHAGTTPMSLRADAGVAAARAQVFVRELAASGAYGEEMRGTVGALRLEPGMVNVVGGRAVFSVDLRNPSDALLEQAESHLDAFLRSLEHSESVKVRWRQTARTSHVPFDPGVQDLIASAADKLGLRHAPILSGAGHDAQEWSRVCKTAMIFVPGEYDGISHNPREFSTEKQCADGISVLLEVVKALAEES